MLSDLLKKYVKRLLSYLLLLLFLAVVSGCAATSAAIIDQEQIHNLKPMASYKSLQIQHFVLHRDLVTSSTDDQTGVRQRRYLSMPEEIAAEIEKLVSARQIFDTVSRDLNVAATTLILKGEFTRISRFRVSLIGKLYDGASNSEIARFHLNLWDVYDTSQTIMLIAKETADFIDRIQYK